MANFTQPFNLTAGSIGSVGPSSSSNFITVDFTNQPGQVVSKYVWGVSDASATGGPGFTAYNDTTLAPLLTSLGYTLFRYNSQSGYTERLFPNGTTGLGSGTTLAAEFNTLIERFPQVNPGARLIMGLGFPPSNWGSASAFANVCQQIVSYFNIQAPGLVYGWEIGNENNLDPGIPSFYIPYFNAAASAIKAVNPNYKMFGPVFSYADSIPQFASGCQANCDVIDYHGYSYQFQSGFDANGGQSALLNSNLFNKANGDANNIANAVSGYVSGGGSSSTPVFVGEYNGNDTYGTLNGGQSPGICNTFMQNGTSAVFNANTILSGLNASNNFQMAGIWSVWLDSDYGVIGGTDNINPGGAYGVCPGGYFLSRAGQSLFGTRGTVTVGSGTTNLACSGGSSPAGFGVMLVNTGGALNGVVALSHWPVNSSGTGTINYWQCGDAHTIPLTQTIPVTAGLTASISIPTNSVVILWSP